MKNLTHSTYYTQSIKSHSILAFLCGITKHITAKSSSVKILLKLLLRNVKVVNTDSSNVRYFFSQYKLLGVLQSFSNFFKANIGTVLFGQFGTDQLPKLLTPLLRRWLYSLLYRKDWDFPIWAATNFPLLFLNSSLQSSPLLG